MNKKFESPSFEIVELQVGDIITASEKNPWGFGQMFPDIDL